MSATGFFLVLLTAGLTMVANLMLRSGIDAAGGFAFDGVIQVISALMKLFAQPLYERDPISELKQQGAKINVFANPQFPVILEQDVGFHVKIDRIN